MKKTVIAILVGVFYLSFVISAQAQTENIHHITTATCLAKRVDGKIVDIIAKINTPDGWQIDFYDESGERVLPVSVDEFSLMDGRRFNYVKSSTVHLPRDERTYDNITPTMVRMHNPKFGKGTKGECSNTNGCAYEVTCW